jgi:hypothetical protein
VDFPTKDGEMVSFYTSRFIRILMAYFVCVAPVHSIAASLFLQPQEVHYFEDIGYFHNPFLNCPANAADRCACNPADGNNFGESISYISSSGSWISVLPSELTSPSMVFSL